LARGSDVVLEDDVAREVSPLKLSPTASMAVAIAVGEALAEVWIERRGSSPAHFALNHPAESLDKPLTIASAYLMLTAIILNYLQKVTRLLEVLGGLTRDGIDSG
jgi:arabinose-5-phosphate isomerase